MPATLCGPGPTQPSGKQLASENSDSLRCFGLANLESWAAIAGVFDDLWPMRCQHAVSGNERDVRVSLSLLDPELVHVRERVGILGLKRLPVVELQHRGVAWESGTIDSPHRFNELESNEGQTMSCEQLFEPRNRESMLLDVK